MYLNRRRIVMRWDIVIYHFPFFWVVIVMVIVVMIVMMARRWMRITVRWEADWWCFPWFTGMTMERNTYRG